MDNDAIKTEYREEEEATLPETDAELTAEDTVIGEPAAEAPEDTAAEVTSEEAAGETTEESPAPETEGMPEEGSAEVSPEEGADTPEVPEKEQPASADETGEPAAEDGEDVPPEWVAAIPELEEEPESPAGPEQARGRGKKKKGWIWALVLLLIAAAAGGGYYYYDQLKTAARDELYASMTYDPGETAPIEYGDEIGIEDILDLPENVTADGTIDTLKAGEQEVNFTVEEFTRFNESVKKTVPVTFRVEDTKYPAITFTRPIALIPLGSEFDPDDNIESVTDPVDGDLEYSEEPRPGTYTIVSDVDAEKVGIYEVTVHAEDINGNETEADYRVRVFRKRESSVDTTPPEIWFNEILQEVKFGEEYDLKDNIYSVYDAVDGMLEYSEELEDGTYTIKGDIDYEDPGDYVVRVRARDKSGNEYSRIFTVRVLEKEEESVPESSVTESSAPQSSTPQSSTPQSSAPHSSSAPTSSSAPVQSSSSSRPESSTESKPQEISESSAPSEISEISSESSATESSEESSETPQGGTWVPDPSTNAGYIYNFITNDMGLNRACGLAILAHMRRESGYSPTAFNPDGYYGLCQWGGGRYDNLIAWCGANGYDYTTLEGQLRFMQMELNGTYSGVLAAMQACSNTADGAYDAAYVFGKRYEVSGEALAVSAANTAVDWFNS